MSLQQRDTEPTHRPPTWGVMMTVDEPGDLIECNLPLHLATRASAAWVFMDDPHDAAAERLADLPGYRLISVMQPFGQHIATSVVLLQIDARPSSCDIGTGQSVDRLVFSLILSKQSKRGNRRSQP